MCTQVANGHQRPMPVSNGVTPAGNQRGAKRAPSEYMNHVTTTRYVANGDLDDDIHNPIQLVSQFSHQKSKIFQTIFFFKEAKVFSSVSIDLCSMNLRNGIDDRLLFIITCGITFLIDEHR